MMNNDDYSQVLGREVPIADIDQELRLLWEADKASTKASLINLAVYSEEKGAVLKNSDLVLNITREHACRAILIGIDRDEPTASIRAWITTHCHLLHGRKSVCCEQIAFQLTGQSTGRLRNTVFAHLNSDLPLVFWWQGELSSIFSERLYSLIDRFIFDSSDWSDPLKSFQCLEKVMGEVSTIQSMDLEWTRSYHIREAIAGLFDDPMAIKSTDQINHIKIVVHPDHRMAGLQLLAWIVSCTEWHYSPDLTGRCEKYLEKYYFETKEGVDVTACVDTCSSSAPIGLVEMTSPNCSVRVSRSAGSPHIHQRLSVNGHVIERCTPAGEDDVSELLIGQLSMGGKHSLYQMMLPMFLTFLDDRQGGPTQMSVR